MNPAFSSALRKCDKHSAQKCYVSKQTTKTAKQTRTPHQHYVYAVSNDDDRNCVAVANETEALSLTRGLLYACKSIAGW